MRFVTDRNVTEASVEVRMVKKRQRPREKINQCGLARRGKRKVQKPQNRDFVRKMGAEICYLTPNPDFDRR
jgi:hypothetical protein